MTETDKKFKELDEVKEQETEELNDANYEIPAEKLSIEKLEQYEEIVKDREKVQFNVEYKGKKEKVYITVEKFFTKTSISACINDYIRNIDKLKKKRVNIDSGFLEMYLIFQLIKHFTDLDMPNDIEKQLVVMERLINTELIFYIFMEFPQEEVSKLMVELDNISEAFDKQLNFIEEEMKKMNLSSLENEEVKNFAKKE